MVPLVQPTLLPAASIGALVFISMAVSMLGKRSSLVMLLIAVPIFALNFILIQNGMVISIGQMDTSVAQIAGIAVNSMALLIGGLIVRGSAVAHEEQFALAQEARYEIAERVVTEQEQRQQVAQINTELEDRIEVASQRREALETLINRITSATNVLNSTVLEMQAVTNQQLASITSQDAAITQTVTAVEEVRATINAMAERAQAVEATSKASIQVSEEGIQAVVESIAGMRVVRERVGDIAQTILLLAEHMQQISEISDTVAALAEQSKLLALNASIEAARAGEDGRGFTVVALEVRQLAEQSRQAASHITIILNEIQQATNAAVMVTEEGSKGPDDGVVLVEQAGTAIQKLTSVIEEAAQVATYIASSTQQQTADINQLVQIMNEISKTSSQAAASTNQTEQSMRELTEMARTLNETALRYEPSTE
jgi:methyl-accepting chemotaxis protein